jgi:hypothetical protein
LFLILLSKSRPASKDRAPRRFTVGGGIIYSRFFRASTNRRPNADFSSGPGRNTSNAAPKRLPTALAGLRANPTGREGSAHYDAGEHFRFAAGEIFPVDWYKNHMKDF